MNNTHIVIMVGGIGGRFLPISTPECPKQFIDIFWGRENTDTVDGGGILDSMPSGRYVDSD